MREPGDLGLPGPWLPSCFGSTLRERESTLPESNPALHPSKRGEPNGLFSLFPTGLRSRDAKTEWDRLRWKERAVLGWWGPEPRAEGGKGRGRGRAG